MPKSTFRLLSAIAFEQLYHKSIEEITEEANEVADDQTLESMGFPIIRS